MGFLVDVGQTLNYYESKPFIDYIKQHGIIQFLLLYKKFKDINQDKTFWGDEIENHLLHLDSETNTIKLQPNTGYMFSSMVEDVFSLQPEYGSWMLETVPTFPYECDGDPTPVFNNMNARRIKIKSLCKEGDILFSGTVYPMLGVGDYYVPRVKEDHEDDYDEEEKDPLYDEVNPSSRSQFVHDDLINPHPRFSTMTENIRLRRGEKVCILAPIYKDEKTATEETKDEPYPGYIYMDAQHFGMGSGCLQLTYGTNDIDQARYLTDQLAVFSSIVVKI